MESVEIETILVQVQSKGDLFSALISSPDEPADVILLFNCDIPYNMLKREKHI